MVAYLQKSEGSEGFHQIIDFLNASHIQTATTRISANGEVELTAIIDGQVKTITEASLRRHLKLEDNGGVTTLPNSEIFEQLALMSALETSPSRITSSPSLSPQHTPVSTPSTSQPPNTQPTPDAEEAVPMPHESPLYSVHSLGRDEGSLSLNELTDLCTSLSKKVEEDEEDVEDSSKQGRKISAIDKDPTISLVQPEQEMEHDVGLPPSTSQPPNTQPTPDAEEAVPMPHESPLHSVHSLGRDEGSLSLNELTDLCTSLSKKVEGLESELKQTKQTYSTALTKLILRVKKLEQKVKTTKARRRARIVLSEDEEDVEDSSKQGRKISAIDKDPTISLVQPEQEMEHDVGIAEEITWIQDADAEIKEKNSVDTEIILEEEQPTELVEDIRSGEKGASEVSSANIAVTTAEPEPEKKTKKQLEQERLRHEEAVRLQEQLNEEETQRIARDTEIARQLHEEINKAGQERVVAKDDQAHVIDWSDPAVLRYHAQLNRPYSVAEVRKNMVMYLKNQGGYKMNYFKGMKYEDIRPIFEKVWDQIQSFVPMDSEYKEKGSKKKAGGSRKKTLARKRAGEKQSDQSAKRQKMKDDAEKEDFKEYLNIVPEEGMNVEALQTKDDLVKLWKLVKDRFISTEPNDDKEKVLWVEMKRLFEPDTNDLLELQRYMHDPLTWRLYAACEVHHVSTEIDFGYVYAS
ncbi:hypothetical protein Tco_0472677 [Tanacetum coccineum]